MTILRLSGNYIDPDDSVQYDIRQANENFDYAMLIFWGHETDGDFDEALRIMHDLGGVETAYLLPSTLDKARDLFKTEFES